MELFLVGALYLTFLFGYAGNEQAPKPPVEPKAQVVVIEREGVQQGAAAQTGATAQRGAEQADRALAFLVSVREDQPIHKGPVFIRSHFSDGLTCVSLKTTQGISCVRGGQEGAALERLQRSELEGLSLYRLRYADGLECVTLKSTQGINCFMGGELP